MIVPLITECLRLQDSLLLFRHWQSSTPLKAFAVMQAAPGLVGASDAPVPTNMAALVFVAPVSALNAVAAVLEAVIV